MTTAEYIIGVDGGGTNARARLADANGNILGEGAAGPGNVRRGLEVAWRNIGAAIDIALDQADLDRTILSRASIALGLAGIVEAEDALAVLAAGPTVARSVAVSDAHIACLGAFGDGRDGAILIAGTGSAAHAIIGGQGLPFFGWGFEVDDRGSAAALGRSAVRASLEALDGLGPDTDFTRDIRKALGDRPSHMVRWITAAEPRDYGRLAPAVFGAARLDDPVARDLISGAAGDLERMIARLVDVGAPRVCLMGGMAPHVRPWLDATARSVLVEAESDALAGAMLLAGTTTMQGGKT